MRLLRILRSFLLPCECFVGVYETYHGSTITIIDEPGATCRDPGHRVGQAVHVLPPHEPPADPASVPARD